jgi:kumamolisin
MVRLPGHLLSAIEHATPLPKAPGADKEPVTLTLVLNHSDQIGFDRYLHDVYDSTSPHFRQFLDQREIARRFGPSPTAYDRVRGYLLAKGFQVVEDSANRLTITVRGTRAAAELAFEVPIRNYRIGSREFYANTGDPALPRAIWPYAKGVLGLSNYGTIKRAVVACSTQDPFACGAAVVACNFVGDSIRGAPTFGPFGWLVAAEYKAACALIALGLMSNPTRGTNGAGQAVALFSAAPGAGQTIGLVEFDSFKASDVEDYLTLLTSLGVPTAPLANLSVVPVNGGVAAPGFAEHEVLLDIDAIMTAAPGAQVAVYEAPFRGAGSFQSVLNRMINDDVSIISNSWYYCESHTTQADVSSIDTLFQQAAAAGISVFNATGDSGSTCAGSPNTASVPASSPNATAVGGSSPTPGIGLVYGTESWWDGSDDAARGGQGGFGLSRFFPRPSYQNGLVASSMRSIPDVVLNADPATGLMVCQANKGGCPTGLLYGGTSFAAPRLAAYAAMINQSLGHNIGAFNAAVYPFANSPAFHSATSMGSDFAHVGLGSPNVDVLSVMLAGDTAGPPDPTLSQVRLETAIVPLGTDAVQVPLLPDVRVNGSPLVPILPADGLTEGTIVVHLVDANGHSVSGKTVTLTANGGHAQITPVSGVSTVDNGAVVFRVTDLTPETVTLTARDTTDGIQLSQTASITFGVPRASGFGLQAFPTTVTADGINTTTITVTLQDALGRPTPGKLVNVSQGSGHSVISGPNPATTDSNGQIVFTAANQLAETVTYTAVDVTDGGVSFPGSTSVTFINGPNNGCGNGNPVPAPGFEVTAFATGFVSRNFTFGSINFGGCPGTGGMAFDPSGNLYVSDLPTGNIYKFGPGGGVANNGTLITSSPIGPGVGGLAFDMSGNLYAARAATTGNYSTGAILQINPSTGAVMRTVASGITCPLSVQSDPLSGDLFTTDSCTGGGANPSIWRISNPSSPSPVTTVYATLPSTPNSGPVFAPNGTLYAKSGPLATGSSVVQVGGTNTTSPPAVTTLANVGITTGAMVAQGAQPNGAAAFLLLNQAMGASLPNVLTTLDLTTNPPSTSAIMSETGLTPSFVQQALGPDGCVYWAQGVAVFKVTDSTGACSYSLPTPAASLLLTPITVSPNPAQGTPVTFTATFHYVSVPADTPVVFAVSGANPQVKMMRTDANGEASFTYAGSLTGADSVVATATVGTQSVTSNVAKVNWAPGGHTTFCNLNLSPQGGTVGTPSTLSVSLFDASASPSAAVTGATVDLAVGNQFCTGVTDASGVATCMLTPDTAGLLSMGATFAGSTQLLGTTCSTSFRVLAPLCSPTPATGCQPAAAQKASLRIVKSPTSSTNKMTWKWTSSGPVGVSDFGSPIATTDYVICLYDNAGLQLTARLPADRMCGTKPCWKALSTVGFKYRDKSGIPDGLTSALLKAGAAGHGKIKMKGKNVPLVALPLTTPVRVQLQQNNSSTCWEASYSASTRNTSTGFTAKGGD